MLSDSLVWPVKFLHLAAISIWSAGLVIQPLLLAQRQGLEGEALHRLHRMSRFVYVNLASPAAFVAIGSGTALIFIQQTFEPWFSAKLLFVGMMTGVHLVTSLYVVRVFAEQGNFGPVARISLLAAGLLAIGAILFLVLDKPSLDWLERQGELFEPGRLGEIVTDLIDQASR